MSAPNYSNDWEPQAHGYGPSDWMPEEVQSYAKGDGRYKAAESTQTNPEQVSRKATELGIFNQGKERWLSLSAATPSQLANAVKAARLKGWEPIHMYEGRDPATGWPALWLTKPVQTEPVQPVVAIEQAQEQAKNG